MFDPNPKYVLINLLTGYQEYVGMLNGQKMYNDPFIYAPADRPEGSFTLKDTDKMAAYLNSTIEHHVRKYGTIEELMFTGHGDTNHMVSQDNTNLVNIKKMLKQFGELEKEMGKPIAKRIVFTGCSTFRHLNKEQIELFHDYAVAHHVSLVGSTSETYGAYDGNYVQFTPDGKVIRDKLDNGSAPKPGGNPEWQDYFIGHTFVQAEAAIHRDSKLLEKNIDNAINMALQEADAKKTTSHSLMNMLPNWAAHLAHHKETSMFKGFLPERKILWNVGDTSHPASAIVIKEDGTVRSYGHISLHPMQEKEKSWYTKNVEDLAQSTHLWQVANSETFYSPMYLTNEKSLPNGRDRKMANALDLWESNRKSMFSKSVKDISEFKLDPRDNIESLQINNSNKVIVANAAGGYEFLEIGTKDKFLAAQEAAHWPLTDNQKKAIVEEETRKAQDAKYAKLEAEYKANAHRPHKPINFEMPKVEPKNITKHELQFIAQVKEKLKGDPHLAEYVTAFQLMFSQTPGDDKFPKEIEKLQVIKDHHINTKGWTR